MAHTLLLVVTPTLPHARPGPPSHAGRIVMLPGSQLQAMLVRRHEGIAQAARQGGRQQDRAAAQRGLK
ncbi:hypothetical protein ACR4XJ_12035 [Nitratidesulfovibrio sp. D1]|uniref:hypothetical protein n=1 Tax=Nitratidesulfovibrio sp. D1 TaxID=3440151 RepID=UPI003EB6E31D